MHYRITCAVDINFLRRKISAIKFIKSWFEMGLKDSKEAAERMFDFDNIVRGNMAPVITMLVNEAQLARLYYLTFSGYNFCTATQDTNAYSINDVFWVNNIDLVTELDPAFDMRNAVTRN